MFSRIRIAALLAAAAGGPYVASETDWGSSAVGTIADTVETSDVMVYSDGTSGTTVAGYANHSHHEVEKLRRTGSDRFRYDEEIARKLGGLPADPRATPKMTGVQIHDLREVMRFDISPDWVLSRFSRVSTVLADLNLERASSAYRHRDSGQRRCRNANLLFRQPAEASATDGSWIHRRSRSVGSVDDIGLRSAVGTYTGGGGLHQTLEWQPCAFLAFNACSGGLLRRSASKIHRVSGAESAQPGLRNQPRSPANRAVGPRQRSLVVSQVGVEASADF